MPREAWRAMMSVELRRTVDRHGKQLAEIVAVAAREVFVRRELRRDLGDAMSCELPLIERLDEQLSGQMPCSRTAALRRQNYCSSWRSTVAIWIAASAASAPLLPAFVPARSMACSIVSTVRTPNPIGISSFKLMLLIPRLTSPAT